MILHRFCSDREFRKYMSGEYLHNDRKHWLMRGSDVTTSEGFCFFAESPAKAVRRLSGIVDFDVCITVDVHPSKLRISRGRYANWDRNKPGETVMIQEWCTDSYNIHDFRLVRFDRSFAGTRPNARDIYPLIQEILKKR